MRRLRNIPSAHALDIKLNKKATATPIFPSSQQDRNSIRRSTEHFVSVALILAAALGPTVPLRLAAALRLATALRLAAALPLAATLRLAAAPRLAAALRLAAAPRRSRCSAAALQRNSIIFRLAATFDSSRDGKL